MRRNEDALLNRDATKCQEGAAEVDETALAEGGLLAIVDVERRKHAHGVVDVGACYLSQVRAHLGLGVVARVHLGNQFHATLHIGIKLIAADVCFSCRLFVHFVLFQVFGEKLRQLIPRNVITLATVVKVAVGGTWDDEQLLVLRVGIGLANEVVAFCLALHHVFVSGLAEVAGVGFRTMLLSC